MPDPGSSGGFNRYAYVANNPLKHVDPSGHCFFVAGIDTAACVVGGAYVLGVIFVAVTVDTSGVLDPAAETIGTGIREGGQSAVQAARDLMREGSVETLPLGGEVSLPIIEGPTLTGAEPTIHTSPGSSEGSFPTVDGTPLDYPDVLGDGLLPMADRQQQIQHSLGLRDKHRANKINNDITVPKPKGPPIPAPGHQEVYMPRNNKEINEAVSEAYLNPDTPRLKRIIMGIGEAIGAFTGTSSEVRDFKHP